MFIFLTHVVSVVVVGTLCITHRNVCLDVGFTSKGLNMNVVTLLAECMPYASVPLYLDMDPLQALYIDSGASYDIAG